MTSTRRRLRPASVAPGIDRAKGYSYGVQAGNLVWISNQIGRMPDGTPVSDEIESQAVKAFENMKAVVEEAGGTMANIVKLTIYTSDRSYVPIIQQVRKRFFTDPDYPAAALIITQLMIPEYLIEIEGVAVLD